MDKVLRKEREKQQWRLYSIACARAEESFTDTVTNFLRARLWANALGEKCPLCGEYKEAVRVWRENTAYYDEHRNWVHCCADCFVERQRCWEEQWAMYYNMVM